MCASAEYVSKNMGTELRGLMTLVVADCLSLRITDLALVHCRAVVRQQKQSSRTVLLIAKSVQFSLEVISVEQVSVVLYTSFILHSSLEA